VYYCISILFVYVKVFYGEGMKLINLNIIIIIIFFFKGDHNTKTETLNAICVYFSCNVVMLKLFYFHVIEKL